MEKRNLGQTGISVPAICLGTMTWGQQNTEAEAHEQLDYAVEERGINFLDTAELYPVPPEKEKQGRTESYIGSWLKKRKKREDLVIASKVCVAADLVQTRDMSCPRFDAQNIHAAIDGTLERLQTDYIDLYQIHWPERRTNFFGVRGYDVFEEEHTTSIQETLEVLQTLIKTGKVRHVGVSNETPWGVSEYLRLAREDGLPRIQSIQNQYSLTNRTFEIGLSEMCMKEEVSLLVYSALNMGVLTGKYLDGALPEGARFTLFPKRNAERYNPSHAQEVIRAYVKIAEKYNLDPATVALAFATHRSFTTSTIIGATTMEQLKVCIDAGEVVLDEDILADIEALYTAHPDPTV